MKRKHVFEAGAVVAVTGAGSGIGKSAAEILARDGMHVYAIARSLPDYFDDNSCQQTMGNGFIRPLKADVTDEKTFAESIERIILAEGRLDCLFQAAGMGIAGSVEDTSPAEAFGQMDVNFFGSVRALPAAVRQMRKQRNGMIVQVGSVAGALPVPFQAYYSASKAALTALTLAMADELRPWGIRCMIVQPGDTSTGFTKARILARASAGSVYEAAFRRSVGKMEQDEMNGMKPDVVAKRIIRRMSARHPPLIYTPGFYNKAVTFLAPRLPLRLVRWVESRLYAR